MRYMYKMKIWQMYFNHWQRKIAEKIDNKAGNCTHVLEFGRGHLDIRKLLKADITCMAVERLFHTPSMYSITPYTILCITRLVQYSWISIITENHGQLHHKLRDLAQVSHLPGDCKTAQNSAVFPQLLWGLCESGDQDNYMWEGGGQVPCLQWIHRMWWHKN